ncbi:UNVERIFIED_CONTAM: hypothetical protein K2H54_061926 [Gekko kuhli]
MGFLQTSEESGGCAGASLSVDGTLKAEEGLASEEALESSQGDISFSTELGDAPETERQGKPGEVSSEKDKNLEVEPWDRDGPPRPQKRKIEGEQKWSKKLVACQGRNMYDISAQSKLQKENGRNEYPAEGIRDETTTL